jgi:hypothetical protein
VLDLIIGNWTVTMKRRSFNKTFLIAGLAAPTVLSGVSNAAFGHDGNDSNRPEPFGRVSLLISGKSRRLEVPRMAAERIDLGDIPLLGQIPTPTLNRQFAGATVAGTLHLVGNTIVLLPEAALPAPRSRVWITHQNMVYRPPGIARRLALKRPPTRGDAEAAQRIGQAVLKDDIILGIVPPSALDGMEFGLPASA